MMSGFIDSLNNMPIPFSFVIWLMVIIVGGGAFSTLCKEVRRITCHRLDLDLKRDLIDQGLDPIEVERVLAAKSPVVEATENTHCGDKTAEQEAAGFDFALKS